MKILFWKLTTIYKKEVKTVALKINPDYVASPDVEIQTISSPNEVDEVLQAIFAPDGGGSAPNKVVSFTLLVTRMEHVGYSPAAGETGDITLWYNIVI